MHDIDLKTLRLLVATCEHRTIGQAAREAHIEPSAISKRITQLERDLGVALLVRSRHGVEPTPAGLALIEYARTALFAVDRIAGDIAVFAGGLQGSVSICASASAIAEALPDDIAAFLRRPEHRNIRVCLEEATSGELVERVRDGRATIGVCWDNTGRAGLESRPYREDRLVLAVPPGHPLAGRRSVGLADLLGCEHVSLPPSAAVNVLLQRAAARLGCPFICRAVVSTFDAAFRVVAAGLGVSIVPEEIGQAYVRAGRVRTIPIAAAWARRQFVVCFRKFDSLSLETRHLIVHLVAQAGHGPA